MVYIYSVMEISCFTAQMDSSWYLKCRGALRLLRGGGHCRLVEAGAASCLLVCLFAQRLFTHCSEDPFFSFGSRKHVLTAAPLFCRVLGLTS